MKSERWRERGGGAFRSTPQDTRRTPQDTLGHPRTFLGLSKSPPEIRRKKWHVGGAILVLNNALNGSVAGIKLLTHGNSPYSPRAY